MRKLLVSILGITVAVTSLTFFIFLGLWIIIHIIEVIRGPGEWNDRLFFLAFLFTVLFACGMQKLLAYILGKIANA